MNVLLAIINTLVVILALLLIAVILVQPSKSGGFGSAFGGLGETIFGAHTMSHLSKLTVVCITIFFILTMIAAIVSGHVKPAEKQSVMGSVLDAVPEETSSTAPAEKVEDVAQVAEKTAADAAQSADKAIQEAQSKADSTEK